MFTPRMGLYGELLGTRKPEGESPLDACWCWGKLKDVGEGVPEPLGYGGCLFWYSLVEDPPLVLSERSVYADGPSDGSCMPFLRPSGCVRVDSRHRSP